MGFPQIPINNFNSKMMASIHIQKVINTMDLIIELINISNINGTHFWLKHYVNSIQCETNSWFGVEENV